MVLFKQFGEYFSSEANFCPNCPSFAQVRNFSSNSFFKDILMLWQHLALSVSAAIFSGFLGTSRRWMVGHGLDRKSNLCPKNVKPMSKVCPEKGHVQGLSHWCPSLVKVLSNLCQVHDLLDRDWTKKSTACLNSVHISLKSCQFLQWALFGHTLDWEKSVQGSHFKLLKYIGLRLDKLWTWTYTQYSL